jgi:Protein of unknown function (DUF2541)
MKWSTIAAFTLIMSTQLFAQDKVMGPELLGTTKLARHHTDVDAIRFGELKCGLSEIQLKITDRPADIDHIYVQYGNGNFDELVVRDRIRRGGSSRWINLRGEGDRCLRKIVVIGDSEGLPGRRAEVQVYGK